MWLEFWHFLFLLLKEKAFNKSTSLSRSVHGRGVKAEVVWRGLGWFGVI